MLLKISRHWLQCVYNVIDVPLENVFFGCVRLIKYNSFQIWREGKCVQLYSVENVSDKRNQKSAIGSVSRHRGMAQPHNAKKGPCQNSEMVWRILPICCVLWGGFWLTLIAFLYSPISHEHIEILTVNGELLFFRQREGPFYPTLRLLHKCESLYVDGIVLLLLTLLEYKNIYIVFYRSLYSPTPTSRQRGH